MATLDGRVALVTGASRGIGAETARALAAAGAAVVLAARSTGEIAAVAEEIRSNGGRAEAVACDVAKFSDVQGAVSHGEAVFGPIDILINNAGIIEPISLLAESAPEAWGQVIDVNTKGVYYGMRAVLPGMVARRGGTIITVSSGAAHSALEGWSHYCTSKAAVHMLTLCADKEAGIAGVRAISLSPGTVATEMQVQIRASGINPVSQLDPSVHIPADWPARAIVWLCGPDGDRFKGQEVKLREEETRREIGLVA
ncbi:MAG: SDR family oxidoreductase [Pseudomonadota bacterium]